jgi:hypothetical protein
MTDQTQLQTTASIARAGNTDDAEYDAFVLRMRARFAKNTEGGRPLFETDVGEELFTAWVNAFPEAERQYHTCNTCKSFLKHYGSLVLIDEVGLTHPAFWLEEDAPDRYKAAVRAMERAVRRARVVAPFYSSETSWGNPQTGIWTHMALTPSALQLHSHRLLSASQLMAEKKEDYGALMRGLADYSAEHVAVAIGLLRTDTLYRSEALLGAAEWLGKLHSLRAARLGKTGRENVVWRAIADAPTGFCHPRSSMIGTLLDDLKAGLPFAEVSRRFSAKMHPLQYQRPQAAPSAGNIAQAEKVVEKLGIAPALRRRFARVEELQALWRPAQAKQAPALGSIFGHLSILAPTMVEARSEKPIVITWEKFRRTVLPDAQQMECRVPVRGDFAAIVTAADPEAPPILQWDLEEIRNPFSWYLYHPDSTASAWKLTPKTYSAVTAITLQPNLWNDETRFAHQSKGVLFVLQGAQDTRNDNLSLFPQILKSELHGIRATIEAHSKSRKIEEQDEASACGLILQSHAQDDTGQVRGAGMILRVVSGTNRISYSIDRWD